MKCIYCQCFSIKKGKQNGKQNYRCKSCLKYFREEYVYKKYGNDHEKNIAMLNNESMGISSISRYLKIPKTTVMRKLESYAAKIRQPVLQEDLQSYDIDELRTFVRKKDNECWAAYGINHTTGTIIDFVTGRRTIENLLPLVSKIKVLNPKKIFTDGLNIYSSLLKREEHIVGKYLTWRIERNHLTIRDRLKRLSRGTLCFSKSERMLNCCVKILVWG